MPSTRAWDPLGAEAPARLFISVEFASTAAAGDHNVEVLGLEVLGTRFEVSECKFEGLYFVKEKMEPGALTGDAWCIHTLQTYELISMAHAEDPEAGWGPGLRAQG